MIEVNTEFLIIVDICFLQYAVIAMEMIKINKPIKVSDLQAAFHDIFPYLKLEFFTTKHKVKEGSAKKNLIKEDFIVKIDDENMIIISENMPVAELEKQFSDKLKLSVQVFRKAGKTWLETTFTDNWTLKKQNDQGKELSQL